MARDLVEAMLSLQPRARPSAQQVLAHPFFWSRTTQLQFLQVRGQPQGRGRDLVACARRPKTEPTLFKVAH